MIIPKSSLLGLPISHATSCEMTLALINERLTNRQSCIVSFINPHAFHLRLVDQAYANVLWHYDLILPDGIGVTIAARWLNGLKVARQSFDETSLFAPVMGLLNGSKRSLCIIGAKPGMAARAQAKMRKVYPDISYLGVLDGYQSFDDIVDWVTSQNPTAVVVGMGAPLQESLLLRLRQGGYQGVGITCGGFLDQYAEDSQYYPHMIDFLELRWLYRLAREPRRLGKRYLLQYRSFVHDVFSVLGSRLIGWKPKNMHLWLAKRYARNEA